jgi:hypothetical protein
MPKNLNGRTAGIAPVAAVYTRSNTLTTVQEDISTDNAHCRRKAPVQGLVEKYWA